MEHGKISNLLIEASDSEFIMRKWNITIVEYSIGNEIIYSSNVFKSNLCDFNDADILIRGNIMVVVAPVTQVAFTDCASFT